MEHAAKAPLPPKANVSSLEGLAVWRSSNARHAEEDPEPEPDDERLEGQALVPHAHPVDGLAPKLPRPRPDRLSRRQFLQVCYQKAYANADAESRLPLCQGRCVLAALVLVQLLRAFAWLDWQTPGLAVTGLHLLAVASDVIAFGVTAPLLFCHTLASCVKGGRAGLMLTLVFALACVDVGAMIAYWFVGLHAPFRPGRKTIIKVAEAYLDLWECTLFASTVLHMGLFACCWRIYKELRRNGLYPAGTAPIGFGPRIEPISAFEVLCEIEDVKKLQHGECPCLKGKEAANSRKLDTTP